MSAGSSLALIYEFWLSKLQPKLLQSIRGAHVEPAILQRELAASPNSGRILSESLNEALAAIRAQLGKDASRWTWGSVHQIRFQHPSGNRKWDLPAVARPGDAYTVNATSGANFQQTNGASYRQIIDVSNWDRSIMTNVPGEVAIPGDKHYADLVDGWAAGRYHPMPFSRQAVEAAAGERILLKP